MRQILFFIAFLFPVLLTAQFSDTPRKLRLGGQTDANYLVYVKSGAPAHTPSDKNDTYVVLDTTANVLYIYDVQNTEWDALSRDTVFTIASVPDTTSLSPLQGDMFINDSSDTLGVYSGNDGWVQFYGGGGGGADNLGNHTATQDLDMAGYDIDLGGGYLSGDGDSEGIYVDTDGTVGVGTATPSGLTGYTNTFAIDITNTVTNLPSLALTNTSHEGGLGLDNTKLEVQSTNNILFDSDPSNLIGSSKISFDIDGTERVDFAADGSVDFNNYGAGSFTGTPAYLIGVDASGNLIEETLSTYTPLTQEQVEDYAGGMWTGNTETLITVTYQDADGTIDAVVTSTLSSYTDDLGHVEESTTVNDQANGLDITLSTYDISIATDFSELTAETTLDATDYIIIRDETVTANDGKILLSNFETQLTITESQISDLTHDGNGIYDGSGTVAAGIINAEVDYTGVNFFSIGEQDGSFPIADTLTRGFYLNPSTSSVAINNYDAATRYVNNISAGETGITLLSFDQNASAQYQFDLSPDSIWITGLTNAAQTTLLGINAASGRLYETNVSALSITESQISDLSHTTDTHFANQDKTLSGNRLHELSANILQFQDATDLTGLTLDPTTNTAILRHNTNDVTVGATSITLDAATIVTDGDIDMANNNIDLGTGYLSPDGTDIGVSLTASGGVILSDTLLLGGNVNTNGSYISGDGDDEGIYVDAAGGVGVGNSAGNGYLLEIQNGGTTNELILAKSQGANATVDFDTYSATASHAPFFAWRKAGGTIASPSAAPNFSNMGIINFYAYDGSSWTRGGYFRGAAGNVSAGDVNGSIEFFTNSTKVLTLEDNTNVTIEVGDIEMTPGGPIITVGSGSPEGSVTADVGSLYLRTDGGSGTSLYVKESGTSNTGWVGK